MRENRQTLQLTQEQLAESLGVQRNTVYRWEAGLLDVPIYIELAVEALLNRSGLKPVIKSAAKKTPTKKGRAKK